MVDLGSTFEELVKEINSKSDSIITIDGLSGGTLTSPLKIKGGDGSVASKIALDQANKGQITDNSTSTLFGFMSSSDLTIGGTGYNMRLRGRETRPKYNGNDLALKTDIPTVPTKTSQLTNDSGFTTNKGTVTKVKVNGSEKSPDTNGLVDLGTISGGSGGGDVTSEGNNSFYGNNTFNNGIEIGQGSITFARDADEQLGSISKDGIVLGDSSGQVGQVITKTANGLAWQTPTSGKQLYWHNIYLEYHTSNIDCNVFLGIVTSSSTAITNATTFKTLVNNYRNLNNMLPVTGDIFIAKSSGVTQALALFTNGNMIFYRSFAGTGSTESIAVSNFTIMDKVTTL